MKNKIILSVTFLLVSLLAIPQKQIKIGIIGLDTSHSKVFTENINGGKVTDYPNFKIVAAYPYGSKSIESSFKRIPGYIEDVKKHGVVITNSIQELLEMVDCVMLETNDGNLHLEQAAEVFKAGKIVFIDKPLGASLDQAIAIVELSKRYSVPFFSSSALRFVPQNIKLRNGEYGKVIGADCYSPHRTEASHPDFGWYGIHGVEMLFTIMGTGCKNVSRMSTDTIVDVVSGQWADGSIGTFRALQKGRSIYGGTAFTAKGAQPVGPYSGYLDLLNEVLKFFTTRVAPVTPEETLEIFT
ncbi:MAG: Gfo/Idh/MocA family oxidoreductase, partial [Porphyromonadaceae bacterium]|nr:Gfo/Idh/MocA family oxidoreductase [Porphyromonadaceae bacterium]